MVVASRFDGMRSRSDGRTIAKLDADSRENISVNALAKTSFPEMRQKSLKNSAIFNTVVNPTILVRETKKSKKEKKQKTDLAHTITLSYDRLIDWSANTCWYVFSIDCLIGHMNTYKCSLRLIAWFRNVLLHKPEFPTNEFATYHSWPSNQDRASDVPRRLHSSTGTPAPAQSPRTDRRTSGRALSVQWR